MIPARAARGLRVRRDHGHARLDQIIPILDALRIALAHQEHDGRRIRRAVMRQPRLPVPGQQSALGNRIDIVRQRQRDHVGIEAVDHRTRLLARAAMRLLDLQIVAGFRLPLPGESLVEILVQLASRIVGHVQQ